jgi:hypothetical protein
VERGEAVQEKGVLKMKYAVFGMLTFCSLSGAALAQTAVQNEEELSFVAVNKTAILVGEESDGWKRRVAFFRAPGDGLKGDPGYYMVPFTTTETKSLKEVQGIWACYQRGGAKQTKGAFHFGVNEVGRRFAYVDRQVQLKKGLSGDQKKLISAGQVATAIVALYFGNPTIYTKGSKIWEEGINKIDKYNTNKKRRIDMTPTIINGRERWVAQGVFSITVKRYYNCGVTLRYKNK